MRRISLLFTIAGVCTLLTACPEDPPDPGPSCGDGVVNQASEECDDGNTDELDGCSNACVMARCGDGITQRHSLPRAPVAPAGDAGMVGNGGNADRLPGDAGAEAPSGDGGAAGDAGAEGDAAEGGDAGEASPYFDEECDDGNDIDDDACTNACGFAVGHDGIRRTDLEPGDDGNQVQNDACLTNCEPAACGDGIRRLDLAAGAPGYEACDDGNAELGDGCSTDCSIEALPAGCNRVTGLGRVVAHCAGRMSWYNARRLCAGWGGTLLTIEDEDENNRVWQFIASQRSTSWIGLNDIAVDSVWIWDGHDSPYRNWAANNGGNNVFDGDCVRVDDGSGEWDSRDCGRNEAVLCQQP